MFEILKVECVKFKKIEIWFFEILNCWNFEIFKFWNLKFWNFEISNFKKKNDVLNVWNFEFQGPGCQITGVPEGAQTFVFEPWLTG